MTTPQTDVPTLQERLRGDKIHWLTEVDVKLEAADALDAHEATIAALVEALERVKKESAKNVVSVDLVHLIATNALEAIGK